MAKGYLLTKGSLPVISKGEMKRGEGGDRIYKAACEPRKS